MPTVTTGLELFHPAVRVWFEETLGTPTDVQERAWPRIAAGEHLLVSAPTGTGKTLTAFLWALDRLLTGTWEGGQVRVLYVSPLKALNNDIERNLLTPLRQLEAAFATAGEASEPVRVMTRSGDTPSRDRQRMVRRPPEILITTPESLNILLTSQGGRSMLTGLETVIFDEIHAAAGSKRGTHWITAVDRLVPLSGEFQRLALSATARPLERIARFIGGYAMEPLDEEVREAAYRPRPVAIVASDRTKRYDLGVDVAGAQLADTTAPLAAEPGEDAWESLARELMTVVRGNGSTLIFANSRRTTERLTRLLNETADDAVAYSHHGSLSRELRSVVEKRLKDGELRSIVATNSLELGIDIGALDEVVLVQTPPTIASAVQRLGRAGHQVGETSKGRLYPLFERDLLVAAVVAKCVLDGEIEAVTPIEGALDVLAQIVLSMVAAEAWEIDALYSFLKTSDPYHRLSRRQFDLVLEMLAGRYADTRVRELAPRITIDRVAGTVQARPGAAWTVYMSGGTIPDRGYYGLRLSDSMAKIGELDEEFVWERRLGDTFSLGAQNWQVRAITHSDVLVSPARRSAAMAPFWRADARNRGFFLACKIGEFLEVAETLLAGDEGRERLVALLTDEHAMGTEAAVKLADLLERQRESTGVALPHRRHLVVEQSTDRTDPTGSATGGRQLILHTGWGGRVNRPLAIAFAAAWSERSALPLEVEAENDCILLGLPQEVGVGELFEWVRPDNLETLLRGRLQRTGLFGGRFRENAGRALLLPRSDAKRRVPLWLTRERSKKLLDAVSEHEDFPVVVETWRTCLQDTFDLPAVKQVLDEIARGDIEITETRTEATSPFAAGLVWQQTNRLMYEDDVPDADSGGISRTLLQELVFSSQLRPRLPAALLDTFERKLHRTYPGYAPIQALPFQEWIAERLAIPLDEFEALLDARSRQVGEESAPQLLELMDGDACIVETANGARWVSAQDRLLRVLRGLDLELADVRLFRVSRPSEPVGDEFHRQLDELRSTTDDLLDDEIDATPIDRLVELLAEWLRFYGPLPPSSVCSTFGLDRSRFDVALGRLVDDERVVVDRFRRDQDVLELCDVDNLERLLRLLRTSARPSFEALPLAQLPLLLAGEQGLVERSDGIEGLQAALERLLLYPAPAASWESDLLPARLDPYYPAWLDSIFQESELLWLGCGRERVTFAFEEERTLLEDDPETALPVALGEALGDGGGRSFEELLRLAGIASGELTAEIWSAAWQGRLTNAQFAPLRRAILNQFKARATPPAPRRGRAATGRRAFDRWRSSRPTGGDWFALAPPDSPADALEGEERAKERARLLLARYGVLFRELLERELPEFKWSRVFRSLRLMELSGEVVAGHFFDGILGPQFLSQGAWRRLRHGLPQDSIYWLNAVDPAAPSGIALDGWRGRWPSRLASNHLVFDGARPVVVSRRHGGELDIAVDSGHPHLMRYFEFLKVMLTRDFQPRKCVDVETINGDPAVDSPYAATLAEIFSTTREPKCLRLRRRY